jgi:hypothetical protein
VTPSPITPRKDWFKSSRSANNAACVEVRFAGDAVGVRDSNDRRGPALAFGAAAWTGFVGGLKADAGERA